MSGPEAAASRVSAVQPGSRVRLGSAAHLALFCRELLETHDPYRPVVIAWPHLDAQTRDRIVSLPIWDIALQTEERAGRNVRSFAETLEPGLLRAAVEMDAFEESRHRAVLASLATFYGIALAKEPAYRRPRDPEWAFMVTGYSECIDSVFGFGLFELAKQTGFFPPELVNTFEPVMRQEGRHILFFVNWAAWRRRNLAWWRRPWFELRVLAVWIFLIWERVGLAGRMETDGKAVDANFTLSGSRELGVEIAPGAFLRLCLEANAQRLAPHDPRLVRPKLVPAVLRLGAWLMRSRPGAPV